MEQQEHAAPDRIAVPASPPSGFVDLVGAGPGDPGLITVKGVEALANCDVVVYDHLVNPRLLNHAPKSSEKIFAGKSRGRCVMKQDEINQLLVRLTRDGRRVVRLKGGDPFVFGRGGEEAEHLFAAGIPFRVVPGVTAGVGVTSYAGVPVTHRGDASAVAFVTGHDDPVSETSRLDWPALARFPGTLVIYMGVGRLQTICETLTRFGKLATTPACLIQNGTLVSQRTVEGSLADLPEIARRAKITPPAILVIGQVVARREPLSWFERLPLIGQTIVVTRPLEDADESAGLLESLGARVLLAPMVAIEPAENPSDLDDAIRNLHDFDWVVFTSASGVRHFLDRIFAMGKDLRGFGSAKIAAIGSGTGEALSRFHLVADLVPEHSRSEGLAEALVPLVAGKRILLPRADRGRETLNEQLGKVAFLRQVTAYRSVDASVLPDDVTQALIAGEVDWITLTSPAITRNLDQLLPASSRKWIGKTTSIAAISPLTASAAKQRGWDVAAIADPTSWEGLVQSLVRETMNLRA